MHNREAGDFQYVFGPVASRRLGLSLGVDLVPAKTCTLDCIYCEAGRTTCKTLERREWVPARDVLSELAAVLDHNPVLDSITFSGSGEPTLHSGIGGIIDEIHRRWPLWPVTVLTNGTLLFLEEVRRDLAHADRVIASFDAASPEVFQRLNRPCAGLSPEQMREAFMDFRKAYTGEFWIEVFVVPGVNDTEEEMQALAGDIAKVGADRVQLNTLDRPGVEPWVQPAGANLLERFQHALRQVEWIPAVKRESAGREMEDAALSESILAMVKRRPLTREDILRTQAVAPDQADRVLEALLRKGILARKIMPRGDFFVLSSQGR